MHIQKDNIVKKNFWKFSNVNIMPKAGLEVENPIGYSLSVSLYKLGNL